MRTFVIAATTAALGLGIAAPAFAQDSDRAPFTGARAGVLLGYDRLQPGSGHNSDISSTNRADGLSYGGDVGYDINTGGRLVLGVEGEVAGSTAKVTSNAANVALGYGRVKAGRDLYAGGRIGYVASPRTLIYAKGGYTNQRLDLTANNGTVTTGNHYNLDGYRVGAGVEEALSRNTYA
ncbi:MAG: outer membrane beta-barrel protein, partial [Sphingomonas sp.]